MVEFVVNRKLGVDRLDAALRAREQIRQAVIALRPDHEIDGWRAAKNLFAFSLCDAAGNRDGDAAPGGGGRFFQAAHTAELGIDLLGRLLADVAGVEDDEIGIVSGRGLDITLGRQSVRHTLRVVDVHLAAERFYVELARFRHAGDGRS